MRGIWILFRLMETLSYGPFFDAYLSELAGGGAVFVGLVETVKSATQIAIAVPLGACADRHSRRLIMKSNVVLGILACACYLLAVALDSKACILICVVAYAVYNRSYGGTMDMMIADAVTKETSTHVSTRKTQFGTLGCTLGSLLQIILLSSGAFAQEGRTNGWSLPELRSLLLSGWLIFLFIAPAQCRFKDMPVYSLESEPDARLVEQQPTIISTIDSHGMNPATELFNVQDAAARRERPWWWVPVSVEGFRLICLLFSGMTTRF